MSETVTKPYWSDLVIDGLRISLAHLEPGLLQCPTTEAGLPDPLRINVVYGDHCFSEGYKPDVHAPHLLLPWTSDASKDKRAFCSTRHSLSYHLPGMVQALPSAKVQFTSEDRNYVYSMMVPPPAGGASAPYPMFFQLKRAADDSAKLGFHLDMRVVSAYQPDRAIAVRRENIRFLMLASKTYKRQRITAFRR